MDKKGFLELTNKVYRLTLLFPKKEPLRYKIREVVDDILTNFITWESLKSLNPGLYTKEPEIKQKEAIFEVEKNLEVLNSYLEVAKWQNWVSYFDILEIQEAYAKIGHNLIEESREGVSPGQLIINRNFEPISIKIKEKAQFFNNQQDNLDSRKEKILKIIEKIGSIQVGEVNKLFPEVSKRTIRRDFQKLLAEGIIERLGEKNNTFYRLKTHSA